MEHDHDLPHHPDTSFHPLRDGGWIAALVILFGIAIWGYQKAIYPEPPPPASPNPIAAFQEQDRMARTPLVGAPEESPPAAGETPVILDE